MDRLRAFSKKIKVRLNLKCFVNTFLKSEKNKPRYIKLANVSKFIKHVKGYNVNVFKFKKDKLVFLTVNIVLP